MTATATATDNGHYCRKCARINGRHFMCPLGDLIDNGADRDHTIEPARFEGLCIICCDHNHA